MRYLLSFLVALSFSTPCNAQGFFKDMAKEMLTGGQQQQQAGGQVAGNAVNAGSTNLPPGQYMMTNLATGQGFYVTILNGGQMLAQDPRLVQVSLQTGASALGGYGQAPVQQVPAQGQPQQGGGLGGMFRGALNNYVQNVGQPAPQQ